MKKTIRHLIEIAAFLIAGLEFTFGSDKPVLNIIGKILLITATAIALWLVIPWQKLMKAFLRLFKKRRISTTILFTDIVGYNVLKEQDEEKALQLLEKNRYILKPLIEKYNGTWIKETVDCTISNFKSAIDAVNCALEIQQILSIDKELNLRIGIHSGEVIFHREEVIGNAVTVASGIEPFAEPGSICVTEDVYNTIRNIPGMESDFLGEKTLKSVDHPIKVYALKINKGTELLIKSSEGKPKPSIAVLPFIDMSADPEQEYFCDGITEEIINALTHVKNLRVIARTSSFCFKGEKVDITDIGKKLAVEWVLEGSVRKSDNRLRITAQLINVSNESHLWSEKFEREMEDVFAIQDEISLAIVNALKVKLLNKEKVAVVKRYTENHEAYNLYLLGRHHWNRRTEKDLKKAIEYFQQALEKDSSYTLAYIGLADLYNSLGLYGLMSPHDVFPKVKAAVEKPLWIDDTNAESHAALAFVSFFYDWDWSTAESEFKRTFELNPNNATAHHYYSKTLNVMGLFDKAKAQIKQAQELDPLSLPINADFVTPLYHARKYDEAIEQCMKTIEMDPHFPATYWYLGLIYFAKAMWMDAIEAHKKFVTLMGESPFALCWLGCDFAASGQRDEALKILDKLNQLSNEMYVSPFCLFIIYLGLDEKDKLFDYLEKTYVERAPLLTYINTTPLFDSISDDPRFKALLKKMGLPE